MDRKVISRLIRTYDCRWRQFQDGSGEINGAETGIKF